MGPYFAPIFDTFFCAHFWYIMPTIWAPFHGPSGHHPPPFLSLPLPLAPLPVRLLWISLPQLSALLLTTGLGSLSEWQHASSSEQGSSVRPKERNSGFDNSGESNRPSLAMPTPMCESEEKQTQCQIIGQKEILRMRASFTNNTAGRPGRTKRVTPISDQLPTSKNGRSAIAFGP